MSAQWTVAVDESGQFEADVSVVAGLVVAGAPAMHAGPRLKERLGEIWGPSPWPPHASHLRYPVARALYALGNRPDDLPEGKLARNYRVPIRALGDALRAGPMHARIATLEAGDWVTYEDCRTADRLTRSHPARAELAKLADAQDEAMSVLIGDVCARTQGFVVAALADSEPRESTAPQRLVVQSDPYLRALRLLFDRMGRLGGDCDVRWQILTRRVEVGELGSVNLQAHLLKPLWEQSARDTGARARHRMERSTYHYRDHTSQAQPLPPLLALADWLANQLRRAMLGQHGSYERLSKRLELSLVKHPGAFAKVPAGAAHLGPLPTLGAAGPPEESILAAQRGAAPLPAGDGWQWDQARAWVRALERSR